MLLPWFMHPHQGVNTLVGILPTPVGTFVRSWANGVYDVAWYPMGTEWSGGASRVTIDIDRFRHADAPREASETAVVDFMHAHPVLCLCTSYDERTASVEWSKSAPGVITHDADDGTYVVTIADGVAIMRHVPQEGRETEICRLSDACGAAVLAARLSGRVLRHLGARAPHALAA